MDWAIITGTVGHEIITSDNSLEDFDRMMVSQPLWFMFPRAISSTAL